MSKVALNSVCKIIGGYAFKSGLMSSTPGKYQVIKMSNLYKGSFDLSRNASFLNDIDDRQKSFLLKDGDILITLTGTVGKRDYGYSVLIKEPNNLLLNQRVCLIRPDRSKIDSRFLLSVLQSRDFLELFYASSIGGTGNQTNVSIVDLGELEIKIPETLFEQKKIADSIEQWDTAIEKTEALIDAKERQFGWLVTRLINRSGHKKKLLSDFISEVSMRNRGNEIDRVLSVTNRNGFVLPEDQFERRVASANVTNYKIVKQGQYAYNPSRINVGSIARLDNWDDGILSPMYTVFKLDYKMADSDYFLHWLSSSEAKQRIKKSAQGSVRETVSFGDLGAIPICLPELSVQQNIANTLNTAKEEITLLKKLADQYRTQKRGLMQKLLSGEWHIKNKEAA